MRFLAIIRIRAINVILPGFKGYCERGYKWRYLKQREIRLFGLMAERLFLDSIGYGNELKYGYLWVGGGSKNPRMIRHQILTRTKGCLQAIYRKNAA